MSVAPDSVLSWVEGEVGFLELNLPDSRNAMTETLQHGMLEALVNLEQDADIRVLVLSAAGRAFSAGGDLVLMGELPTMDPEEAMRRLSRIYPPFLKLLGFPAPTIAAINGPAVGGGLGIASLCDIRIAAESARFSAPFGQIGLPPGMGLTVLLPELLGHAKAMELLLTGSMIDAQEAHRIGLVSEVVADDELKRRSRELAEQIAAQSRMVNETVTKRLRGQLRRRVEEALEHEVLSQSVAVRTADYRARIQQLIERLSKP